MFLYLGPWIQTALTETTFTATNESENSTEMTTKPKDTATSPVGCSLWRHTSNTAAENGVFYGWTTESNCMGACLMLPSCVAIDVGPLACLLHFDADDLSATYFASGIALVVLDRACLPTSPISTGSPPSTTTTVGNITGTGMSYTLCPEKRSRSISRHNFDKFRRRLAIA